MKRYFCATPSPKELALGRKMPRTTEFSQKDGTPKFFMTFNLNSLNARLKNGNLLSLCNFIREKNVDFISFQEVRLPAESPTQRNQISPKFADSRQITRFFQDNLDDYAPFWSLADKDPDSPEPHHVEGRIAVAVYDDLTIISTYVPNNGRTEASFERRIQWDKAIHKFLTGLRQSNVSFILTGDLNVAPESCDMSDPVFYKRRKQPGCTDEEQARHRQLLSDADCIDAYRFLNPVTTIIAGSLPEGHTWRGHDTGMYNRKTMRIDHFVVARELSSRLDFCVSNGPHDWPSFFGSDHCPVLLRLSAITSKADDMSNNTTLATAKLFGGSEVSDLVEFLRNHIESAKSSARAKSDF